MTLTLKDWEIALQSALRDADLCAKAGNQSGRDAYIAEALGYKSEITKAKAHGRDVKLSALQ